VIVIFFFTALPTLLWGPQAFRPVGIENSLAAIKRLWHDSDPLSPFSAFWWRMHGDNFSPLFSIMELCLINNKDNMYFEQSILTVDRWGMGYVPLPQTRDESKTETYLQLFKLHWFVDGCHLLQYLLVSGRCLRDS